MTDNEIVKALECCGRNSIAGWLNECKNCPLHDRTTCIPELMYNAKDLINRQKEEIERLRYNLKAVLDERADHSEAIKEFAERLKSCQYTQSDICGYQSTVIDVESIDNLLKELEGEQI